MHKNPLQCTDAKTTNPSTPENENVQSQVLGEVFKRHSHVEVIRLGVFGGIAFVDDHANEPDCAREGRNQLKTVFHLVVNVRRQVPHFTPVDKAPHDCFERPVEHEQASAQVQRKAVHTVRRAREDAVPGQK